MDTCFIKLCNGTKGQVILFPYLGGHAHSLAHLASQLDGIEIWALNLPGHGTCTQHPLQDIDDVIYLATPHLVALLKPNHVFFGHSMGGILAYFLFKQLLVNTGSSTTPENLMLSACSAPSEFSNQSYATLPDDQFIVHLSRYGALPPEVIQDRSLIDYFLPVLRSDFKILESTAIPAIQAINTTPSYFFAQADPIASVHSIGAWSPYFDHPIKVFPLRDARHMYIQNQSEPVARVIHKTLEATRAPLTT